jgi:uncharacterized spore protein YtfJ
MNSEEMLDKLQTIRDSANVDRVFGKPKIIGEKAIIPIAQVSYGFGGGYGEGKEPGAEEDSETRQRIGKGGGGGGGVSVTPKAVLEVTPAETKLISIVDTTRIALAAILLVAWNVFWVTKTARTLKKGSD